jgi:MOSC domain-containing protein YiiM
MADERYSNAVPDRDTLRLVAVLLEIWIKRAHRGTMDSAARATLVAGRGIEGNADQGGRRQVTLVDLERWQELTDRLGRDLDISARRANLVIDALDLFDARGRTLRIGRTRLRVLGETRPCERMDEALPGLQAAMRERWGGGAFAEVIDGGEISVGDEVEWDVGAGHL